MLIQNLDRLNDNVREESDGIHNSLSIIENLVRAIHLKHLLGQVVKGQHLMTYLKGLFKDSPSQALS